MGRNATIIMKLNWKSYKYKENDKSFKKYKARHAEYTLTIIEEELVKFWWFISSPKAIFNLSSKKVFSNFDKCKSECQKVLGELLN